MAAVPIVAIGAPLGAFIINKLSRNSIALFLYIIILLQFIGAVYISISKNEMKQNQLIILILTAVIGFILFGTLIKTKKKTII